jgi:hypothetical protein
MGIMRAGRRLPRWARTAVTIVAVWDLAWKGLALWQAAKRRQPVWFVALLLLNTVGILPMVYLWLMRRRDAQKDQQAWDAQYSEGRDTTPAL